MVITQKQRRPEPISGERPSVSVALVTYDRAGLLHGTIASILRQTMADFELIIADDRLRPPTVLITTGKGGHDEAAASNVKRGF
jgi:hypothetical protein